MWWPISSGLSHPCKKDCDGYASSGTNCVTYTLKNCKSNYDINTTLGIVTNLHTFKSVTINYKWWLRKFADTDKKKV